MIEMLTANLGSARAKIMNGREVIVAPMTMLRAGVFSGSQGPLLYPVEELGKHPGIWDGSPIVLGHPRNNQGQPISARRADVLKATALGLVMQSRLENQKLRALGVFDVERTKRIAPEVYNRLNLGLPIELSTGVYTDNENRRGEFGGREYKAIARNYQPDHLAILTEETGACSIGAGCGVFNNHSSLEDFEMSYNRKALIQRILANSTNVFAPEQLAAMDGDTLLGIASLAVGRQVESDDEPYVLNNYIGMAAPHEFGSPVSNELDDGDMAMGVATSFQSYVGELRTQVQNERGGHVCNKCAGNHHQQQVANENDDLEMAAPSAADYHNEMLTNSTLDLSKRKRSSH